MKTEVYSWRVSSELKSDLEREARVRKISLSSLLDSAARDWLKRSKTRGSEEEEQRRLHASAESCLGALASGNRYRAETARKLLRERLTRRYAG
jgi:hypothetical protein